MPAHDVNGSPSVHPEAVGVACPQPFHPASRTNGGVRSLHETEQAALSDDIMSPPASDNTAAGMSLQQEESMYSSIGHTDGEKEKIEALATDGDEALKDVIYDITPATAPIPNAPLNLSNPRSPHKDATPELQHPVNTQLQTPSPTLSNASVTSVVPPRSAAPPFGIPLVDEELRHDAEAKPWEFSTRRLYSQHPSALFQPSSKYIGTQQSDRQIYNVEVTILTIDMEQCTTSGYLQICGLTPDHPTLTTFFTGEIIGGPDQRFGFRTKTSEWGATDKTDMTHWARFPAWRSLSSQAKQNLGFTHPCDQSPWWQQESIFMRWKEHFLVPDYKLRSIQGASFEGFYYICLNQIEGKISGIYFHSKSEKYQQLELKHEGQPQAWSRGVCPSVEFR